MRHCLDCASHNSCVNCAVCSSIIVQTRCDLKPFMHFKRERACAWWFSHAVCEMMSHRNFSNYFISYLMKKYELYSIIIISSAPDKDWDGAATCLVNPLTAGALSAWDFLDRAFLETADQSSQRHYRSIVIGSRSIGAPLVQYMMEAPEL